MATDRDRDRRQAWRDVFEAHAALMELLEGELRDEAGVSVIEYDVLLHLSEAKPPVRMYELADAVVLSKSGLTRVVDRMERGGLLARIAIAGDRRSTAIRLTEAGEDVFRKARTVHRRGIRQHFLDHVDDRDVEVIRRVFARARDAARARLDSTSGRKPAA
jgi:DNA-binding MarR family transcriptional regulator